MRKTAVSLCVMLGLAFASTAPANGQQPPTQSQPQAMQASGAVLEKLKSAGVLRDSDGPDSQQILAIFDSISQVPRCSKHEGRIAAWVAEWAQKRGLAHVVDASNNVIIRVPGSTGRENEPSVALQAHMDMVCAKTQDSLHDFSKDPIQLRRDGEWLTADNTTLGADDGIGVAMALFMASDPGVSRPPLELVFTTDEEMDMSGAANLSATALQSRRFINIDWETEGSLALGAAGGNKIEIMLPIARSELDPAWPVFQLNVEGLSGGHSGITIHKGLANANVLAAQVLKEVGAVRVVSFEGGTADNAVAPAAKVVFAVDPARTQSLERKVHDVEQTMRGTHTGDPELRLALSPLASAPERAVSETDSNRLIALLLEVPQGVHEWSSEFPGLPETSNNIGIVHTDNTQASIIVFHRSFQPAKLEAFAKLVEETATRNAATFKRRSQFPTWTPQPEAGLYKKALAAYQQAFGKPVETIVVHAGLECGFIAEKYPEMEIISIGPTLLDVHTPKERLHVPSVERASVFLREILRH